MCVHVRTGRVGVEVARLLVLAVFGWERVCHCGWHEEGVRVGREVGGERESGGWGSVEQGVWGGVGGLGLGLVGALVEWGLVGGGGWGCDAAGGVVGVVVVHGGICFGGCWLGGSVCVAVVEVSVGG